MDEVAVFLSSLVSHLTTSGGSTDLKQEANRDAYGGGGGMPPILTGGR